MLIVEGPDGVGKTTLCRRLLATLPDHGLTGHVYAHFSRLPDGFDRLWGYAERASRRVVQDRFHLSEIVYARARGDRTPLCPETYRLVDARLRLLGAWTVLVTADEELVRSRWDPSQMYDLDRTLAAARLFATLGGWAAEYEIDVDRRVHCTRESPYVTDDAAREVAERYAARQLVVAAVAGRRPPGI